MYTRNRFFSGLIVLFLVLGATRLAAAAEAVAIGRDSPLLEAPAAGAAVVAQLPQGTAAELIGRQGAWVHVKTAAGTGWVMSFNVRYGAAPSGSSASGGSGLGQLFTSRRTTTATIGIRGLEAEDLKSARVDIGQLQLLDRYAAGRAEAEQAAQAAGLGAVKVDYFNP